MTEKSPSRPSSATQSGASRSDRFVLQKAHERGVTAIELWAVDPLGWTSVVTTPIDALDVAFEDGFAVSSEALTEVLGDAGELYLAPDPATFCLLPAGPAVTSVPVGPDERVVARLICDLRTAEGAPSPQCGRTALKRTLGRATQLGSTFYVGATLQHHWMQGPEDENPLADRKKVRALGQATSRALEMLGIAWRSHYLGHDGRFCLELDWVDPLMLADAVITYRRVVQDLAIEHGVVAAFTPHPWPSASRSRLDFFVSLARDGASAFFDPLDARGLSPTARAFMGALEAELGGLDLALRRTVGSYAASDAPRIVRGPDARGEGGPTVQVRGADAGCNPYPALALVIGLGAEASDASLAARGAPSSSLVEAAHHASASARIRDVLGAALVESLARVT